MLAELSQLIPLGGAIKDIAAAMVEERDRQKLAALKIDLTNKVIDLQAKLLEVQGAVILEREASRALTERNRELEGRHREEARYELAKLGTAGDFFAYRLRPEAELSERATEPPHFICQACFGNGKKSVLLINSGEAFCPSCRLRVSLNHGRGRERIDAGFG